MATKKSSQFLQNLKDVVNQTVATQKSVATNARINFAKQATTPQPYTKTTSTNPVIKGATNVKNALNYLGNAGQYLGNTLYGAGKQVGKQMVVQPAVKVVRNIAVNPNVAKAGTQNSAKLRAAVLGAVPKAIYQETIKPAAQQTLGLATKAWLSALTAPKQINTSVANLNPNNKIPEYLQARPQTTYNVPKALQGLVGGKKIETLQKGYQAAGEQTGQIWKQNIPAYEKVVGTAAAFTKPVLETVGGFGLIKGGLNATAESLSREFGDNPDKIAAWQRMGYPRSAKELKTNFGQAAYNLHPDRPTGNIAEFEKLNSDYQLLQKTGLPNAATQSGILTKIGEMSSRAINPISQLGAINPQQAGYLAENAPMLTQNAGQPVSFPSETSVNIPISQQYLRPAIGLSVKEVGNQPDINKVIGKAIVPQNQENLPQLPPTLQRILSNIQEQHGSKDLFLSQWENINNSELPGDKTLAKGLKSDLKTIGMTPSQFYDNYSNSKVSLPTPVEDKFVPVDTTKFNNLTDYLGTVLRTPKLDFTLLPKTLKESILDIYIKNWYETKGIPFDVSVATNTKKKILTDIYNGIGLPSQPQPTLEQEALKYKSAEEFVNKQIPVYHGSPAVFETFDKTKLGTNTGAPSAKEGFFFSSDKDVATGYASTEVAAIDGLTKTIQNAENKIKALTNDSLADVSFKLSQEGLYNRPSGYTKEVVKKLTELENKISNAESKLQDIEEMGVYSDLQKASKYAVKEAYLDIKNPYIYDMGGKEYRTDTYKKIIDTAKANGNDSVIIKNTFDPGSVSEGAYKKSDIYVVFEPSQIKTKSQLTDIWNKAHNGELSATPITPLTTAANNAIIGNISNGIQLEQQNANVPAQGGQVIAQGTSPAENVIGSQVGSQEIQNAGTLGKTTTQPQVIPAPQNINTDSFNISDEAKAIINDDAGGLLKEPISNKEVIATAEGIGGNFRDISDNQKILLAARQLKIRQVTGALAEKMKAGVATGEDAQNLIKLLKIEKDHASAFGFDLQAQKIAANPNDEGALNNVLSAVVRSANDIQPVLDAAAKMTPADWQNGAKVQAFYRQFIKPTVGEVLTEYRMANMLSGPRTGIRNFGVNVIQGGVLRPLVKLVSGGVDQIGSALSGKQQTHYIQEVAPYYKGFMNSIPQAFNKFVSVMKSGMYNVQDVKDIPTGKIPAWYTTLSRALGAADAFSHEMIYEGEKEAMLTRASLQGKQLTPSLTTAIDKQAHEVAAKYLFHGKTDMNNATGQGYLMSGIDKLTNVAYAIRRVPGGNVLIPFIKTAAEVMKQGIELTPLGAANIPGSADKVESLSKSIIGSLILLGAASLAARGLLTADKPKDKKSAALWDAAHKQPWSIKIGNKWISYDNLGPLGTPFSIAAIIKDALGDNPSDTELDNAKQSLLAMVSFVGSQTWIGNLSDISDVISGKDYAITQLAASSIGQFIPQEALLRSLAGITDAIKRNPKTFIDKLKANIPILEKTLPAATDINGQPLVKQFNFFNSVSPFTVYKEDPNYVKKLNDYNAIQTFNAGRKSAITDIKTELAQKIQNGTATVGDVNNAVKAGVIPDNRASVEEFIAENKFVKERANLSAKIASGNATVGDLNNAVKSGWIYDSKSAVETFVMSAKDPVIGYFANLPTVSQLAYMQKLKEIGDTTTINKLAPYVNKDWWKYNKK